MHRPWFKVWQQGQAVAPPLPVASLSRGAQINGNMAIRRGRGRVLVEVYVLAADAAQAEQVWTEAQKLLVKG